MYLEVSWMYSVQVMSEHCKSIDIFVEAKDKAIVEYTAHCLILEALLYCC